MTPKDIFESILAGNKVTIIISNQREFDSLFGALRAAKSRLNKQFSRLDSSLIVSKTIRCERVKDTLNWDTNLYPATITFWLGASARQSHNYNVVEITQ